MDRTFEAVVLDWDSAAVVQGEQVAALRARIESLCDAGVHVAVVSTGDVLDVDGRLAARPCGPGFLHLLLNRGSDVYECSTDGPRLLARPPTPGPDEADHSGRWLASMLADHGVGSGLVLVIGALVIPELSRATAVSVGADPAPAPVLHLGGGADRLIAILDGQLARRGALRVPDIDHAPRWVVTLAVPDRAVDAAVQQSLFTLSDGLVGTPGVLEEQGEDGVLAAGVYTDAGDMVTLLRGPTWVTAGIADDSGGRRLLDLRTGVLLRESANRVRSLRFLAAAHPGVAGMRVEAAHDCLTPGPALLPCHEEEEDGCTTVIASTREGGIAASARTTHHNGEQVDAMQRLVAIVSDPHNEPDATAAQTKLEVALHTGFDRLLADQRREWAQRWAHTAVAIYGDPQAELAVRFALFHLLAGVADEGEAPVGARGLTGSAYAGHVFWDADVFVLPVLAATRPAAARAMLQYRIARLDVARQRARRLGLAGAFWPWESADDGEDVTPPYGVDRNGTKIAIRTGENSEHIVAAVAWAAWRYAQWTGDDAFLAGPGLPLVLDGARFWSSRVRPEANGALHLYNVIGPDEYHGVVDDNAYTNVMARWNLRTAAALAERVGGADSGEIRRWREAAEALVDGYDPATAIYEEFTGFHDLTPLIISDVAQPPVAADLLLGRDVVHGSQVVKQADVLMLHHLIPDEVEAGSLVPNLEFYSPRTAHGSSLSPAIHAALWARAGHPDRGLELLRTALRLDLDDLTGTTAGGLHLATFGGVWQALAHGFLGLQADGAALLVDPRLPGAWDAIDMTLLFRGARVGVMASHEKLQMRVTKPLRVRVAGRDEVLVEPPGTAWRMRPAQQEKDQT